MAHALFIMSSGEMVIARHAVLPRSARRLRRSAGFPLDEM
jgi:hypothetical protein